MEMITDRIEGTVRLTTVLPVDAAEAVRDAAAREHRTVSAWIRAAVLDRLERR